MPRIASGLPVASEIMSGGPKITSPLLTQEMVDRIELPIMTGLGLPPKLLDLDSIIDPYAVPPPLPEEGPSVNGTHIS